jgi:hypothetical protein
LFDHELLYIRLRDEFPERVKALFRTDALSIPENATDLNNIRALQSGPVFWVDNETGSLQMRYTARKKSVLWHSDTQIQEAAKAIENILLSSDDIVKYKLASGEGVFSNNCLHGRSAFTDTAAEQRLFYRARFYNRIAC